MAEEEGKPRTENLSDAFEQVRRDAVAWASAEQDLLRARAKHAVRRIELAALLAIVALLATLAATVTLADMFVVLLTPSLGPVVSGLVVAGCLLIVGALLVFWIKSLLPTKIVSGRTLNGAKVIWSAFSGSN